MQNYPDGLVLEDKPCPNGCISEDSFVLEGQDRLHNIPGRFKIVKCKKCCLLRTNPRPTPNTIGIYYPSDYGPYQSTQFISPAKAGSKLKKFIGKMLNMDSRVLPAIQPGRLFEIGCSAGQYLLQMKSIGWDVSGLEYSSIAAKKAINAGLDVEISSLERAVGPNNKVDLIVAWMVLEHLHQPVESLKKIKNWIKPNGYLVASIPDCSSYVNKIFGEYSYDLHLPNHLFHYSPSTIEKILKLSGWELEKIRWQKNANTFINSLEYIANEKKFYRLSKLTYWVKNSYNARHIRFVLNWIFGITKQSGRVEIWARPISEI